jgi:hypothetical protein
MEAVRAGKPSPISFEELVEVTETTFLVQQALTTGQAIQLMKSPPSAAPDAPLPEIRDAERQHAAANGECACA